MNTRIICAVLLVGTLASCATYKSGPINRVWCDRYVPKGNVTAEHQRQMNARVYISTHWRCAFYGEAERMDGERNVIGWENSA